MSPLQHPGRTVKDHTEAVSTTAAGTNPTHEARPVAFVGFVGITP